MAFGDRSRDTVNTELTDVTTMENAFRRGMTSVVDKVNQAPVSLAIVRGSETSVRTVTDNDAWVVSIPGVPHTDTRLTDLIAEVNAGTAQPGTVVIDNDGNLGTDPESILPTRARYVIPSSLRGDRGDYTLFEENAPVFSSITTETVGDTTYRVQNIDLTVTATDALELIEIGTPLYNIQGATIGDDDHIAGFVIRVTATGVMGQNGQEVSPGVRLYTGRPFDVDDNENTGWQ